MKNIPYYVPVICNGHFCPMDCEDGCPYADEAMTFLGKEEDNPDVPWAWLESYAKTVEPPIKKNYVRGFLEEAKAMFILEIKDDEDYEPDDSQLEMGFDPYMGCYTDDC